MQQLYYDPFGDRSLQRTVACAFGKGMEGTLSHGRGVCYAGVERLSKGQVVVMPMPMRHKGLPLSQRLAV